jgi:hypothetical protein
MRPFETIPGMGIREIRKMMEGVNSTIIKYKKFGKCHNVPPVNNNMVIIF